MRRLRGVVVGHIVVVCLLLFAESGRAQMTLSGLAGIAKDATGNPVAEVTVEVESPVLIERTRSVVTDGQGQFKLPDLLPGHVVLDWGALMDPAAAPGRTPDQAEPGDVAGLPRACPGGPGCRGAPARGAAHRLHFR